MFPEAVAIAIALTEVADHRAHPTGVASSGREVEARRGALYIMACIGVGIGVGIGIILMTDSRTKGAKVAWLA
ncbi:hypothetical protein N7533_012418 [Penicillium manginii]|uniref:uncharacterized protein n=1 Tax=Penicillium manginii TaxID=203109 RepID=UPI002549AC5F|nr:uncharacterized protein N7533_012418 [Penicillium manginii]KAJ5739634.1 hypothetical protein N7533_012418 [Penicillium manginii]